MRERESQEARLRKALEEAPVDRHHPGGPHRWVSVSQIMRLGISQYNARISELRRHLTQENSRFCEVVNCKIWNAAEGRYHSNYCLMEAAEAHRWASWWSTEKSKFRKNGHADGI
jgi:hypothetical protein